MIDATTAASVAAHHQVFQSERRLFMRGTQEEYHHLLLTVSGYNICMYFIPAGIEPKIVEPPHNQTVPINSVARFTCKTTHFVVWEINGAQLSSDNKEVFHRQGIRTENESVLLVNATLENNETKITCRTGMDRTGLNVTSTTALLAVFGE